MNTDERSTIAREVTSGRLRSDVARDHDLPASTVREIAAGRPVYGPATEAERVVYQVVVAALEQLDAAARASVLRDVRNRFTPPALSATASTTKET